jgi:hypothetical protein
MKKYRLSQVIAMLEENPKLKFESNDGFTMATTGGGLLRLERGKECSINLNVRITGECADTWTLVQQPIPFLEAVQAYAEGKDVECHIDGRTRKYKRENCICDHGYNMSSNGRLMTTGEILYGVWYISEKEE